MISLNQARASLETVPQKSLISRNVRLQHSAVHEPVGSEVKIFRNLNTTATVNALDQLPIQHKLSKDAVIWSILNRQRQIIWYSPHVQLSDVTFSVGEKGRQKVLQTGQKNVHAFISGRLIRWNSIEIDLTSISIQINANQIDGWVSVYYNPYQVDRYVIPASPFYIDLDLHGREVIFAEEGVVTQTLMDGKRIPVVMVKNPILSTHQATLKTYAFFA